jgi:hypothetical protein
MDAMEELKGDSMYSEGKRKPNTKVGRTSKYAPFEKDGILPYAGKGGGLTDVSGF